MAGSGAFADLQGSTVYNSQLNITYGENQTAPAGKIFFPAVVATNQFDFMLHRFTYSRIVCRTFIEIGIGNACNRWKNRDDSGDHLQ